MTFVVAGRAFATVTDSVMSSLGEDEALEGFFAILPVAAHGRRNWRGCAFNAALCVQV